MSDLSRLVTKRLVLTFLNENDVDDITDACQDPSIAAFTRCPSPYTRKNAEEFVHEYAPSLRAEGTAVWSIRNHQAEFVGVVDFHNKEGRGAELGYWLAAEQRGHVVKVLNTLRFAIDLSGDEPDSGALRLCVTRVRPRVP